MNVCNHINRIGKICSDHVHIDSTGELCRYLELKHTGKELLQQGKEKEIMQRD